MTVAVVQAGTALFDSRRTLEKVREACAEAIKQGAALVVFPEAFVGGYPKGLGFGAHVGSRSEEGREEFRRYYEAAVEEGSKEIALLGKIAAEQRIHLVIGVVEREAGTLYCSVLFFGPDGRLQGKHRKLVPTGSERLIWGQGDGSTMPAIQTDYGVIGAAICWENYMPLFRTAMYAKGVTLWCAPTVDDRETWQATMRHIAIEGRCFVLSACQYLLRSDCPADYQPIQGNNPETVLIKGGSVIVSPMGKILAGPLRDGEGILAAEVDLREVARGKFDLDTVGHYARPDVFSLKVDERPNRAVRFGNSE
ncbi:MAG TPA: nitrilase-related carbon-nitrogen hydrolase [Bryobacteraceae bacterium]|nr:nitrilase-related carbon-nitrogen hydrolase [Bryobacteraceae bacterium]